MKSLLLFSLTLLIAAATAAQNRITSEVHATRERSYDVLHYRLAIDLDERSQTCAGDVTIRLVPLRTDLDILSLDATGLSVSQVLKGRQALRYRTDGDSLLVELGRPFGLRDTIDVVITYSVTAPPKGLYFITPDSGYPKRQWQIWSQGEAEENHYWFPCYDFPNDKATSEIIASVNDRFTVVSNGRLLSVKRDPIERRATFHWLQDKPHSSYLIAIAAGEYTEIKDQWRTIPVSYFVYPFHKDNARVSFSKTPAMIEFFSQFIGVDYPWDKYSQIVVQDFMYGGMENTSAATLNDATVHDERADVEYSSNGLIAHELAHQWWGDLLTCRDWSHAWLNEGFASYFDILYEEHSRGKDDAMKAIAEAQSAFVATEFTEYRRPTVCAEYVYPMDNFDIRIYGKGACILHMLRFYLGDDLFRKAINHYTVKHAYGNVETNDFKIAIEEASGYNLHWFFEQWVYKAGYPEFRVTSTWSQPMRSVRVNVRQTQTVDSLTGIFTIPLDIEVWVNGVPETYRVTIDEPEEDFSFPAYQQPQLVLFDKGSHIIKQVQYEKPVEEWMFQLEHAADGVDRLAAVEEVRWLLNSDDSVLAKRAFDALSRIAIEDRFWAVRRDVAYALGDTRGKNPSATLISAYGDRDPRVRAACVTSLANYSTPEVIGTLRHAFEKDSSYSVNAAALSSLTKADPSNMRSYCTAGLVRSSHNDIIRVTALRGLARLGDEEAMSTIMEYTRYGIERDLRIEAVGLLGRTWRENDDVIDHLIMLLKDPTYHVRRAVIEVLGSIGNEKAIGPLQRTALTDPDTRLAKLARESYKKLRKTR